VGWNAYHDDVVIQSVLQSIGIAYVLAMAIKKQNILLVPLQVMRNKMFDEIMKYFNCHVTWLAHAYSRSRRHTIPKYLFQVSTLKYYIWRNEDTSGTNTRNYSYSSPLSLVVTLIKFSFPSRSQFFVGGCSDEA
jgi:hypothetical protein